MFRSVQPPSSGTRGAFADTASPGLPCPKCGCRRNLENCRGEDGRALMEGVVGQDSLHLGSVPESVKFRTLVG